MTETRPSDPTDPPEHWTNGWLNSATHIPSPNIGARPDDAQIDLIVIHSISLPPGQYGTHCVQRLFTNRLNWDEHPYFQTIQGLEVSAHFFIDRQGHLMQFASTADRAWHAGVSQWRGRSNCNNDSIGIELEGHDQDTFTTAQYTQLSRLCATLMQACPIRYIAGHEHIAPGRKTDPGPGFDWALLQRMLNQPELVFPDNSEHGLT
jgi:AmpD protein